MSANNKVAATFHPMSDADLIIAARDWPADRIDAAIILDLADALERHVEETPDSRQTDPETLEANNG
jgi:hypothetical protein